MWLHAAAKGCCFEVVRRLPCTVLRQLAETWLYIPASLIIESCGLLFHPPFSGLPLGMPLTVLPYVCAGFGRVVRDLCSQLQSLLSAEAALEAAGTAAAAAAPAQPSAAAQADALAEPDAAPLSQQVGADSGAGWGLIQRHVWSGKT